MWRADVVVVGGGPIGVCSAHALAAEGADVLLLERETEVCPAVSGAHANCGLIVPSDVVPLASPGALGQGLRWLLDASSPFYIAPRLSPALARWLWLFRAASTASRVEAAMPVLRALHVASSDMHDALGREHGPEWLYYRNGLVQAYETEAGLAAAVADAEVAASAGVPVRQLTAGDVEDLFPGLAAPIAGGLAFDEDAHLDPLLFVRGMAALAVAAGARLETSAEALTLEPGGGRVRVVTTRGDVDAGQVVLAAGAWLPALARRLGLRLPIEPAKGYSVDVERPAGYPELPLYLGEAHVVLTPLGSRLRLGSTLELSGWDMRVRPRRVARLRAGAARVLGLDERGPYSQLWRGPRPVTPDGLPVIGRVPGAEQVIVAGGHCMLGLSLGPVTGRLVADLVGGRAASLDLGPPLSPRRFG